MDIKGYCISLARKQEKWPEILEKFEKVGFTNISIQVAVDGKANKNVYNNTQWLTPWAQYKLNNKIPRQYHSELPSWGAVGCYMSHVILWQQLLEDPENNAYIIFEDDVSFADNCSVKLLSLLENVPSDSDFVFLDISWSNHKPTKYDEYYNVLDSQFFGTHAYIVTKNGAAKMMSRIFPIEIQIDAVMSFADVNKYVSKIALCSADSGVSSVQSGYCTSCYPNVVGGKLWDISGEYFAVLLFVIFCIVFAVIKNISTNKE